MRYYFSIMILLFSISAFAKEPISLDFFYNYLNSIKDIKFDIIQEDSKGDKYEGILLISKKNNSFRWNYFEPYPLLITGNKSFVTIYDYEMNQATNIKTSENIFNFLINDKYQIEQDFKIRGLYKSNSENNLIIHHKELNKKIHLTFSTNPINIKSIYVFEADSSYVKINFLNFKNVEFKEKNLFHIKNPDIFGPPIRYNKNDIFYKIIE